MTDLILPPEVAALLQTEECSNAECVETFKDSWQPSGMDLHGHLIYPHYDCSTCQNLGTVLVPDQLLPLEELLTVECPLCHGTRSRQLYISGVLNNVMCENAYDRLTTCGNRGRIPLPEGDYRIGTVKKLVSRGVASTLYEGVFSPFSSQLVHLRQLEWEKVRRAPHAIVRERRWVQPNPPRVLWVRPDLYDELSSHNPKGVLQIGEAT